jgi:hypothetical protein
VKLSASFGHAIRGTISSSSPKMTSVMRYFPFVHAAALRIRLGNSSHVR